jgi:hypothetical protein
MSQEFFVTSTPPEDFPVTFQVALGASDGWLIASDTKENRYAGFSSMPNLRETVETRKITYHRNTGTVYTSCGDYIMREACRDVVDMYESEFSDYPTDYDAFQARLRAIGDATWKKERGKTLPPQYRCALFAFGNSRPFWTLQLPHPREKASLVQFTYDRVFNGDHTNPSKFFVETYHDQELPVRALLPLAAHTILMGGELNPSGVGGLEIVFCEKGKIVELRFGSAELKKLSIHTEQLYSLIRSQLLNASIVAAS